jgi:hypothetical protein
MSNKKLNYYYSTLNQNGQSVFHCLLNDSDEITEVTVLDTRNCKNYRMNDKYEATDECLFKFRDDLIKWNDEIKQHFFKNKDKKVFKIDVFHYNTINDAVFNNVIINSDQTTVNELPDIKFREFAVFENCLSCGLMCIDKDILETPIDCYGMDYPKFYFEMMKRIRIPKSSPEFYVLDELNFDKLDYGIYRVKVICNNKEFWNVFKFNDKHHYNHNTLKTLYKYKDKYGISFKLLEPDECFNYNLVYYEETVELRTLFKQWFNVMTELLKKCDSKNWLLKTYVSQSWGCISKYLKTYVPEDDSETYDWDQLSNITATNKYKYYNYNHSNGTYAFINGDKAFAHKGLARIKPFLTEFSRNFIFNMLSEHDLASSVLRVQTDGICFNREINFDTLGLQYAPLKERKTTGNLVFHNVNSYDHICSNCGIEYKYDKVATTSYLCKSCK